LVFVLKIIGVSFRSATVSVTLSIGCCLIRCTQIISIY